nr:hypothetical protein [Chloroflexia bacterium]
MTEASMLAETDDGQGPARPRAALTENQWRIVEHLKRAGTADAETLASVVRITPSGTRQHLATLARERIVECDRARGMPGRPRHLYRLTETGDALFPRAYAALTNELLGYLDAEDADLLGRIFERRAARRLDEARERLRGRSFEGRVAVLADILDRDGYVADAAAQADGSYLVTEHNCAILSVARHHRHACSSELDFLRAAMPDAAVTRVAHRLAGGHVCAYRVAPAGADPAGAPST